MEQIIDYDTEQRLMPYLQPGEQLLWAGHPKGGVIFRKSDIFVIPFSIVWGGFAIFWEVLAISGPAFFWLFGIPFVMAGLYLMIGRFFYDARKREQTAYGLTRERIIIVTGNTNPEVKSLSVDTLSDISYSQRADGTGTITFGSPYGRFLLRGMDWPGQKLPPMLELINDVRTVYDKIIALQVKK